MGWRKSASACPRLVAPALREGVAGHVCHYDPKDHGFILELRRRNTNRITSALQ